MQNTKGISSTGEPAYYQPRCRHADEKSEHPQRRKLNFLLIDPEQKTNSADGNKKQSDHQKLNVAEVPPLRHAHHIDGNKKREHQRNQKFDAAGGNVTRQQNRKNQPENKHEISPDIYRQ